MPRKLCSTFLAALAIAIAMPAYSWAQQPGGVTISVRRGIGGYARQHSSNPLEVEVASTRFFSGSIEVSYGAQIPEVTRVPLEVPGGSNKVIGIVVPRDEVDLVRAVDKKGREVARTTLGGPVLTNGQPLIGVFATDTT